MNSIKRLKRMILGERTLAGGEQYPSLEFALQRYVGRKRWERIKRSIPDERQWLAEVAKQSDTTEWDLLKKIAEKLGLSVLVRTKSFDLEELPVGVTLEDLKRCGVLPIITNGEVNAVACTDPAQLLRLPNLYRGSTIHLTLWPSILAALDEAEQNYIFRLSNRQKAAKLRERRSVAQVLGAVLQRISAVGANSFTLSFSANACRYHFCDRASREWSGTIDEEVSGLLDHYLSETLASGEETVEAEVSPHITESLRVTASQGTYVLTLDGAERAAELIATANGKVVPLPLNNTRGAPFVLLVDDNKVFLQVLQRFLRKEGIKSAIASSYEEAMALLAKQAASIDVVVTDLYYPIGGAGLLDAMKRDESMREIPVIVLSNDESVETERRILATGAAAYLQKAREPQALSIHLRALIEKKRAA